MFVDYQAGGQRKLTLKYCILYFYRCVHMVREMFEAIPHLTENRNVGLKRLKRVELGTTPSNSK